MKIKSYTFGSMTINGEKYTTDLIIYPDKISNWWRKQGHRVSVEDLQEVLEEEPEVLIIGKGSLGLMEVAPKTKEYLERKGIKLIAEPTKKASQTYNRLGDSKKVIGAFHLTC